MPGLVGERGAAAHDDGTFIYGDHGSVGASNTLQVKFLLLCFSELCLLHA